MNESKTAVVSSGEGSLQASDMTPPPFFPGFVNYNMKQNDGAFLHTLYDAMDILQEAAFTAVEDISLIANTGVKLEDHEAYHASLVNWVKDL